MKIHPFRSCTEAQQLDVLDAILGIAATDGLTNLTPLATGANMGRISSWHQHVGRLATLLDDARSPYRISAALNALETRTDTATAELLHDAVTAGHTRGAGDAGRDLDQAWQALRRRPPNPSEAYRLVVRAVEHAAALVVIPNDPQPNLPKVISALRKESTSFRLVLGSGKQPAEGAVLVGMISMLNSGQGDRHPGPGYVPPTMADAEDAARVAANLVYWFCTGRVARMPGASTGAP